MHVSSKATLPLQTQHDRRVSPVPSAIETLLERGSIPYVAGFMCVCQHSLHFGVVVVVVLVFNFERPNH